MILIVALLLISTRPCAWPVSNNVYASRDIPHLRKTVARSRSPGAPVPNVRPAKGPSRDLAAKGRIKSRTAAGRAPPASRPRRSTSVPARICRGCR